jgi:hypothetical protein
MKLYETLGDIYRNIIACVQFIMRHKFRAKQNNYHCVKIPIVRPYNFILKCYITQVVVDFQSIDI